MGDSAATTAIVQAGPRSTNPRAVKQIARNASPTIAALSAFTATWKLTPSAGVHE